MNYAKRQGASKSGGNMVQWAEVEAARGNEEAREYLRLRNEANGRIMKQELDRLRQAVPSVAPGDANQARTPARKPYKQGLQRTISNSDTATSEAESEVSVGSTAGPKVERQLSKDAYRAQQRAEREALAFKAYVPEEYLRPYEYAAGATNAGDVRRAIIGLNEWRLGEVYYQILDQNSRSHFTLGLDEADAEFLRDAPGAAYRAPALWELMCRHYDIKIHPARIIASIEMGHGDLPTPITSGFSYPVRHPWNVAHLVRLLRPDSTDMLREMEKTLARAGFDHHWVVNPVFPTWTVEVQDQTKEWLPLEAVNLYPHLIGWESCSRDPFEIRVRIKLLHDDWPEDKLSASDPPVWIPGKPKRTAYRELVADRLLMTGLDVALRALNGHVRLHTAPQGEATSWQIGPSVPLQALPHLQNMWDHVCARWQKDFLNNARKHQRDVMRDILTQGLQGSFDDARKRAEQAARCGDADPVWSLFTNQFIRAGLQALDRRDPSDRDDLAHSPHAFLKIAKEQLEAEAATKGERAAAAKEAAADAAIAAAAASAEATKAEAASAIIKTKDGYTTDVSADPEWPPLTK
jgi:hypothetical protein